MIPLKTLRVGMRCIYWRQASKSHKPMLFGHEVVIVKIISDKNAVVRTEKTIRYTVSVTSLWELPVEPE